MLTCPSPAYLPNPGIKPRSLALQADSLPSEPPGKPKNTGVGSLSLLQGIFPIQEYNRNLLHFRRILADSLPAELQGETRVQFLVWEDPLEKGMAIHSSILAWRIPWTEESGGCRPQDRKTSDTTECFKIIDAFLPLYCFSLLLMQNISGSSWKQIARIRGLHIPKHQCICRQQVWAECYYYRDPVFQSLVLSQSLPQTWWVNQIQCSPLFHLQMKT